MNTAAVLACFPMREEAKFFAASGVITLITGIGRHNTEQALARALAGAEPGLVVSCGFAGGLNPDLPTGAVIFDADPATDLTARLLAAGARPARFHHVNRIVTSAEEKRQLRQVTGADAVEMESQVVRDFCRARGLPSATIRVISDPADQDLPLDFNRLMTATAKISYLRLAGVLLASPGKVPALLRLQRQSELAARNLAGVLTLTLAARPAAASGG
jgi:nucleoside phosphorylase